MASNSIETFVFLSLSWPWNRTLPVRSFLQVKMQLSSPLTSDKTGQLRKYSSDVFTELDLLALKIPSLS